MSEPKVFRKVALDRLSSPEQLDQLLHVTTARGWVALLALCGTLLAALVWGFTGYIDTTLTAQGVISRAEGVNNVVALGTGTVIDIPVDVGDLIQANQVVARIAQPALEQKLRQAKAQLTDADRARRSVLSTRTEGDIAKLAAMKQQIAGNEQEIRNTLEQVRYAREQIPIDDQLVERGLITKQTAIQDRQKVASLESRVSQLQVEIEQVKAQQIAMQNESTQLAVDHSNKINDFVRNVDLAEHSLRTSAEVVVPEAGRVVDIISYRGALISSGQPILSYEPLTGSLKVLAYPLAEKAKEIQPGMIAHISPSGVQREEHGYLIGKVSFVGYFPVSAEAIGRVFENEALARAMMSTGPVTEIHIDLEKSPATRSGYVWSSTQGPPVLITTGSVCSVEIVTRAQHPIDMVIPYLNRKLGLR
jgi:HlyD family secretion protein